MGKWIPIPISAELFKNVDPSAVTSSFLAMENCFVTEQKGISRFPGYKLFADLGGSAPVYLDSFNQDLIAVTGGKTHRVDQDGNAEGILGSSVLGGRRTTFARAKGYLLMASGDRIVNFNGVRNSVLSNDAPIASHVGYIDQFAIANNMNSESFQYSEAGNLSSWPALNILSATSKPDIVSAMFVTPFNELLLCGPDSVEQFDRVAGTNAPFFRRWSAAEGISEPYSLCYVDNAAWMLNHKHEFVRLAGQIGQSYSDQIGKEIEGRYSLDHLDTYNEAWAYPLDIKGQKFIVFQSPNATNEYGGKGVTYVLDIRQSHWFQIFGWDSARNKPSVWPIRSIFKLWGRVFLGGIGKIYEMTPDAYNLAGDLQRVLMRTAQYSEVGTVNIDAMRVVLKRGQGSNTSESKFGMRVNRDNRGFSAWQYKSMGKAGDNQMVINYSGQGAGEVWQFEFQIDSDVPVEIRLIEAETRPYTR